MTTLTVEGTGAIIQRLTVSGHAGFAESGRDIVCAAASILIATCANALESVAGIKPDVWQDEKAAVIRVSLPNARGEQAARDMQAEHDAQVILRTVLQGFRDIAEEYPEHITIIDRRK